MQRFYRWLPLALVLLVWTAPVQATRQYFLTQASPLAPAQFDMGTTQALTFSVNNTSNGTNAGERLYEMRFRLPTTGTVFSSSTAAPAGWTRISYSTTSVTFRASDWSTAIPSGSTFNFSVVLVLRTSSADVSETLLDARASFTLDTNFADGISRTGRVPLNNPGSWTLKSLQVTSLQTVDISSGLAVSTIIAGQSFRLVMTVRNISSAIQSSIISSPNPPSVTKTGTVTQGLTSTVYSPNPLTLGVNASGTITFTYTTLASDNGTISFTAFARNGGNTATSRTATSNVLTVSGGSFIANIAVTPKCAYFGQSFNVKMDLINNYPYAITGITPSLTPTVGGIVSLTSGPTPATQSIGASTTLASAFQWNYQVTGGNGGDTLSFRGSATGSASAPGSGTKTTPTAMSSPPVTRGGYSPVIDPLTTNADSTYAEITLDITHNGCGTEVKSVSIAIPAGWTYNGDGYAQNENWNPPTGNGPVVFAAPLSIYEIPAGGSGSFSLILNTPTSTGSYNFTLVVTDNLGASATVTTTVPITVLPFNSGTPSLNNTTPGTWREEFR